MLACIVSNFGLAIPSYSVKELQGAYTFSETQTAQKPMGNPIFTSYFHLR